ncbi:MAG: glutamine amidotransferase [Ardenticatenaceae bacterium]|nr:glutamine amidotransferase [Ardenticatenaceae bacterium]HBY92554.1 cytoplasmic protein [Chloroflexota bacterium]
MNVLIAGESWITHSLHIKGVDHFTLSSYGEGVSWLRNALEQDADFRVTHLPSHLAIDRFPSTAGELSAYAVVILSDIGSNSLLLPTATAVESKRTPNRLRALQGFVAAGGGLCMVGGYMSFQGIDAKARYHRTPVEEVLPVRLQAADDRVELPEGADPVVLELDHPIVAGIPKVWPAVLGYNQVSAKPGARTLVECCGDPLVTVWEYEKGRSMAFATDCAPHWAPPEFLQWEFYGVFWRQAIAWLAGDANRQRSFGG